MTEDRYLKLMQEIGGEERQPAPLHEMWQAIEREHFHVRRDAGRQRAHRLRLTAAMAATLLVGIALGRASTLGSGTPVVQTPAATVGTAAAAHAEDAGPFRLVATEYLDQAATLLTALPEAAKRGAVGRSLLLQAHDLLSATRLLLDSPAAEDVQMRALLSDLELVLAQVSHLSERLNAQEVELINEALEQREVLPRLRLAAAEYPLGL